MQKKYTLQTQIEALERLGHDGAYEEVSQNMQIPLKTLKRWVRKREEIRSEYVQGLRLDASYKMAQVQNLLAEKAAKLAHALTEERIEKAPLNQVSSALGAVIDRYLKLEEHQRTEEHEENPERIIRYEFRHPDGSLRETPYFAEGSGEFPGTLQSSRLRQEVGQDGTSEDYLNGKSRLSGVEDMVARTDLPDGEPGLAGSQIYDDERNWYHD